MITPPFLEQGDTIGMIAPARSVIEQEIAPFLDWTGKMGYKVKMGESIYKRHHQFSGTDRERLQDLDAMIADDNVKAIVAARGGYGCGRLLEDLNIQLFSESPKWLIGFSDLTALLVAVNRIAKVETIHSWMPYSLKSIAGFSSDSIDSLVRGISGKKLSYKTRSHEMNILGESKGILTGGNLSVLYSIGGTPYEPDYEGKVLFLEDVDEYLYHIDRIILNFEMRGIFNDICGLVIGSFNKMRDNDIPFGKEAYEIIAERAEKYNIPTLFDFPAGHENRNHTLIFGREVTLSVKEGDSLLDFSA
jgi:muramoyltetrapeptide carboxypeptidase